MHLALSITGITLAFLGMGFLIASPAWYECWRNDMWYRFRLAVRALSFGRSESLIRKADPEMRSSWEKQLAFIRGLDEPEGHKEPSILTTNVQRQDTQRLDQS